MILDSAGNLYEGRQLVLNAFKGGLFPLKAKLETGLKYQLLNKCSKDYQ